MKKINKSKTIDKIMTVIFYMIGIFFIVLLGGFCIYIIYQGIIGFKPEFLSFSRKGIGNQFFNTVYLVFLSLVISTPMGILTGIYLSEYAKENKLNHFIRICIETMSSLPSVVVGLFGSLVFIEYTGMHWNLMAGALAVSILNFPLIATTTEDAFKELPDNLKKGSMSLGATQWQSIVHVQLPACIPRIITGIILAAGRGFGEAAALLFTAGMSTDINWANWNITSKMCPLNPFRPGETLSLYIWVLRSESINPNAAELANFSSAVLIIMVLLFSSMARLLTRRIEKNLENKSEKMNEIFYVKDLDLYYGTFQALKKINMNIDKNNVTALIGPSGCGKSTFIKTLNRMNDLEENVKIKGDVFLEDKEIFSDMDAISLRKRVGMVFQQPNSFPKSIFDNVVYGLRINGVKKKSILEEAAEESLKKAAMWDEVKDRLNKSALGLSGGQQQRLCIARALAVKPEVILMDEPTSALDPISTAKIEELILELKKIYTVVIVTHNMQQATRIADKTAFFYLGELIEFDNTEKMFTCPKDKRTENYITGRFG